MKRAFLVLFFIVLTLCLTFSVSSAYYYGGYSMYGGLYGMYGGLYGMYGGLYGMYGGLYGMYGGLYGMYGLYGMSMYSPFSFYNLYYPIDTGGGLTYQVPFLQIAPLLGVAGLYNQLFPSLFNPSLTVPAVTGVTISGTAVI